MSYKPKKKPHGKGRPWPKGVSGNPSGKASRLSRMGEEFMREMFKPYGLAPDVRVHRTPQHVQFIQQPIKARRRRCQILLLMFFWGPKTGASCAFVSDKTFIFTMR